MSAPPPQPRRRTAKQQAVQNALGSNDNFRSAQQLYQQLLHERPVRIGLTSVYRILRSLADDGIAETQRAEDGELLYRLRRTTEHCHYLLCRRCGRAVGFRPSALEGHTADLVREHHYAEVTHRFDLYGTCPDCQARAARPDDAGDSARHSESR